MALVVAAGCLLCVFLEFFVVVCCVGRGFWVCGGGAQVALRLLVGCLSGCFWSFSWLFVFGRGFGLVMKLRIFAEFR